MDEPIKVAMDARGVAYVTIDHARKLNALSTPVMQALVQSMEQVAARDDLRAVVLAGAGGKAFIGGADVNEMAALEPGSARRFITQVHRTCRAMVECPVPVVARIEGHVIGAGLEVAAACDLRIASTDAHFSMPEVRLGLPSVVEAALLPRLIGSGRARWLVLTGESIDAARALDWGLVEEVVARDALDAAVEKLVATLARNGPQALRIQKRLCRLWDDGPLDRAIDASIDAFAEAWQGEEPARLLGGFVQERARRKA